jgi:hypothetical protein
MADKNQTEYLVLLQSEGQRVSWVELGKVNASSQSAAKKQALSQYHPEGGTVVAVPVRSWEPEDLKPKLSFG